jgi:Domain of unknown function (DUF5666)
MLGVIQSLNNQTIQLTSMRGKRVVTVTVNASTKYSTLEGQAAFSDLKVGESVDVTGLIDAQAQTFDATQVIILPPLGRVSTINGQALALATNNGTAVTVNISNSTIVYVEIAGRPVAVSAKAIEVGQVLGYEGTTASDGAVSATKLWLLGLSHVRGTVSAINGSVVTLQALSGSSMTVNLSSSTTYVQPGKAANKGILASSNIQALQVGSIVEVTTDGKVASGTATAILIIIG